MGKLKTPRLFLLVFLLALASCAGLTGGLGGGNNATDDGLDTGDAESDIQAVLPMPSNDDVIISMPDSGSVAYLQAEGLDPSYSLMVTNTSAVARYEESIQKTYFATLDTLIATPLSFAADLFKVTRGDLSERRFLNRYVYGDEKFLPSVKDAWLMRFEDALLARAMAQTSSETVTDLCSAANTVCLDISEDGKIVGGELPGSLAWDSYTVKYVDSTANAISESEITEETKSLLYMADAPASEQSIVFLERHQAILTLGASGTLGEVRLSNDGEAMEVNSFSLLPDSAALFRFSTVLYNTDRDHLVFKSRDGSQVFTKKFSRTDPDVLLNPELDEGEMGSSGETCVYASGCSVTDVKVKFGRIYYATQSETETEELYINEIYRNPQYKIIIAPRAVLSTVAFDVSSILPDGEGGDDDLVTTAVAVTETADGNYYLSANDDRPEQNGKIKTPLALDAEVLDVFLYASYLDNDLFNGEGLLLTPGGVTFFSYDFLDLVDDKDIGLISTISWSDHNALTAALSGDDLHNFLYILNDDNSVTVINTQTKTPAAGMTFTFDGTTVTTDDMGRFSLADALGFQANFNFSEIQVLRHSTHTVDTLILGSENMRGFVVMRME